MDLKLALLVTFTLASLTSLTFGHHHRHGKQSYRWIDLTYALNNNTVVFPGRKMLFGTEFEGPMENGDWLASKGFCISEHTSTHVDAPYHFFKNGKTLSEIPLEDMLDLPGVAIDIYDKVHKIQNGQVTVISNYAVTRKDILEWEAKNGLIPSGSLVLIRTGWGDRWPNSVDYLGIVPEDLHSTDLNSTGDPSKPYSFTLDLSAGRVNFPGFDSSAAQFLCTERNVNGVGIDTLSLDVGNSHDYIAHKIFTKNGVFMLENVANVHLLPPKGFKLFAVPFKVDKGTGSPTRVLAKLPIQGSMEN